MRQDESSSEVDEPGAVSVVLALTITWNDPDAPVRSDRLLVAVRAPATNGRFPNTLSVPTQRIPAGLLDTIVDACRAVHQTDSEITFESPWVDSQDGSGAEALLFAVESILCRKLGAAVALEEGRLRFRTRLASVTRGLVEDPNQPDAKAEMTVMANAVVEVEDGIAEIPPVTSTYSTVAWISSESFKHAVEENDALLALPGGDPFELCVKGLCVETTRRLIERGVVV